MSNKTALVTGASAGIGRAAAVALQKAGYDVVLAGRRKAALDETAAMANDGGGKMLSVACDVADPESVSALFADLRAASSRLDVLFNNAGIGAPPVPMEELSIKNFQDVMAVNVTGAFQCAQEAIKMMKDQDPMGGRIINNGSIAAYSPRPLTAPYTASKHAITGLTKAISIDCRKYNVACSQIDIGNADTEMGGGVKDGALQPDGEVRVEPVMDVQHVADAVVYMAGLPLSANVQFMTLIATNMPYLGRG